MREDIVDRLRNLDAANCADSDHLHDGLIVDAADEIERLRKEAFSLAANQCHAGYGGEYGHHRCREIDRLTAERDEARREVCAIYADTYGSVGLVAERRGWNCFKEASDGQ